MYLVFNTIMNLTSQDEQVQCFCNAADHLIEGGHFVVEVLVPALQRLPPGETIRPSGISGTHIGVDEIDAGTQALTSHHLYFRSHGVETSSIPFRYVWPSGAGSDGPHRRHDTHPTVVRLGSGTVHERITEAHLGLV